MIVLAYAGTRAVSQRWVSVDEVSSQLGLVRDTIYRWIETRRLPAHRIDWFGKFRLFEVNAWVEGCGAGDDLGPSCKLASAWT